MPKKNKKTLLFLLESLVDARIVVELRNDTKVEGIMDDLDFNKNLYMKDAVYMIPQRKPEHYDWLMLNGNHIRYVHIPSNLNVTNLLDKHNDFLAQCFLKYSRRRYERK